jgi:hypothetical protein
MARYGTNLFWAQEAKEKREEARGKRPEIQKRERERETG